MGSFACRFSATMYLALGMFTILGLTGCASHREALYQQPPVSYISPLTMHQIEKGIMEGCQRRNWIPTKIQDGVIEATLHLRDHVAVVRVHYNQQSYTVKYERSENLNYERSDRKELIHPSYNKWVQNLIRYINASLARYDRSNT